MSKKQYIIIGIITTLTLIGFIWGFNFLKGKDVFNKDNTFYVVYDKIYGLEAANPVYFNGFKLGLVKDVYFLPDMSGKIVVKLLVNSKYKFSEKTVARIFSADIMGTKAVELINGNGKEKQQNGDTLIADFDGGLQEIVNTEIIPLKDKAESLITELENAIEMVVLVFNEENRDNITGSIKGMNRTFNNLAKSSSSLDSIMGGGKIDNIITNIESISNNIEKNNMNITNSLSNLSNITDSISNSNISLAVNEAAESLKELNQIIQKINKGKGSLGALANNDTLYRNLEDASYNLNLLLEDLRMNPKRYVHLSAFSFGKSDSKVDKKKKKNSKKVDD